MAKWTVVYVNDDMGVMAAGQFPDRARAVAFAERVNTRLDADYADPAGGGGGFAIATPLRRAALATFFPTEGTSDGD